MFSFTFVIREVAFSKFTLLTTDPHFHARISINASNIVGLLSSKTITVVINLTGQKKTELKFLFLSCFLRQLSSGFIRRAALLQTISHSGELNIFLINDVLFHPSSILALLIN